jgi:hypothetical protein
MPVLPCWTDFPIGGDLTALCDASRVVDSDPRYCWNPSLRHRRRASIRLVGYYGYSDTRAFVTENLPTFYSHVDYIVDYINHVITMLVLHQLATKANRVDKLYLESHRYGE